MNTKPSATPPGKLILVRHGQSTWNVENLFTGWHDVDLSELGRREATQAGAQLLKEGLAVDLAWRDGAVTELTVHRLAGDDDRPVTVRYGGRVSEFRVAAGQSVRLTPGQADV